MLLQIWEIVVNISEPLLFSLLLRKKLEIRSGYLPFAIFGIIIAAGITTALNLFSIDFLPTVIIGFTVFFLYSVIFFKGSIWKKAVWSAIMIIIIIVSNTIDTDIFLLVTGKTSFLESSGIRFAYTLTYMIFNAIIVLLVSKVDTDKRYLPLYIRISIVALCLIGCVSLYLLMDHIVLLVERQMSTGICVILSAAMIIYIIYLLVFMDMISRSAKKMNDAQVELTKANAEAEYNTQVSAVIDTFREIKHDYASHITAIAAYANDENWDALKKYLSDFNAQYGIEKYFISTGNRTFDSIVTSKALLCSSKGISFDTTVLLPPVLPFSDIEIAALFGNLLDNAINAQDSVEANRYIFLEVKTKGKMLCITVKNSSGGIYKYNKGELVTSNADTASHGLGLKRIRAIVTGHGGSFNVSPEADSFTARMLVPLET